MKWQLIRATLLPVLTLFCIFQPIIAQKGNVELNTGWIAKKAGEVPSDGTQISRPEYKCYDLIMHKKALLFFRNETTQRT